MGNKLLFLVGVLALSGVAYADAYADEEHKEVLGQRAITLTMPVHEHTWQIPPARSQVVHEFTCINTVDECARLMGETATLQRYDTTTTTTTYPVTYEQIPAIQSGTSSIVPQTIQTLTTSFPTAVLTRLDAIEARLDTIAKFQKDVVAPMHKEMLDKLKEMHP